MIFIKSRVFGFSFVKVLLFCFIPYTFAAQSERDYERQRRIATDEYVLGHFDKAERLYLDALHQAEAKNNHSCIALSLLGLGNVYQNQGHHAEARAAYFKSLSVLRRVPATDFTAAAVWHNLADSHTALGRYPEAVAALKEAARAAQRVEPPSHELNGLILNSYGVVSFYQGKDRKAETYFREAIRSYASGGNSLTAFIAQTENNLASLYRRRRQFDNAEQSFKKSIELGEQQLGPLHPDLAVTLENLGSLYIEMKRYTEAEAQYRRSLSILEQNQSLQLRQIHALHLLSRLYISQRDIKQAEAVLARAAELIGTEPIRSAEIPDVLETYSMLLKSVGKGEQAQALHSRAVRAFGAATLTVRLEDLRER